MFLKTADEIEVDSEPRKDDPMCTAQAYSDDIAFEAKLGKSLAEGVKVATPLAVAEALKSVFDPEIPVDIYALGLIYDIQVAESGDTSILMTLTSPGCPVAGELPGWVAEAAADVSGVGHVGVKLTFDPPWNFDMMNGIAAVELGIY
jgi:FeS assembly SUF system protein